MFLLPDGARAELHRQINDANPSLPIPLLEKDLYFGKVQQAKDAEGRIKLPTVSMYDSEFEGYATFQYERINLTNVFGSVRPVVKAVGSSTLHDMLPQISKGLGMTIKPEDVINVDVNWLGGSEAVNIEIIAKPNSPGFEGRIIITYQRIRPLLSNVVKSRSLDVLHHIQEDPDKRSTDILTWGIDFTEHIDEFAIYGTWWRDGAAVQRVMAEWGFANWPAPWGGRTLKNYKTADVPQANKKFTNVIIQTDVVGADYAGKGYFHYNR